jgi:3-oxoacyl-(acyl-carrier-protein) synthase
VDFVSRIFVRGTGAVSPAGWGVEPLRAAVELGQPPPAKELSRPGWQKPLPARNVPPPNPRPAFLGHARLRRSSPISQYAVAAAVEALGVEAKQVADGSIRLGIVFCAMSGCVNYSRRFYDEVLRDPATASPLVFPETVFNAPSSHLAAFLGTTAANYTLVGDPGIFLQGAALAAQWLAHEIVDACLVVGSEEMDWLTADAFRLFTRRLVLSEGAGALYLRGEPGSVGDVELAAITDAQLFWDRPGRLRAAKLVAKELRAGTTADWLCDGGQGVPRLDEPEALAWADWRGARVSPKKILGEGLMAAAAWQCVLAVEAVRRGEARAALASVIGCNEQAIGARFCGA